ncbi:MAG: metallophosphoesterase [Candidatus Margulisbacteria bacterium]|nr:metallophosphoesterase [Candidatus Margulisiibacteriota bacterium]
MQIIRNTNNRKFTLSPWEREVSLGIAGEGIWRILVGIIFIVYFTITSAATASTLESFSFIVFGDSQGNNAMLKDLADRINREEGIAFCVNNGDSVPSASEANYKKFISLSSRISPKVYTVVGNHDVYPGGYGLFHKYFGPTYYSFDYGSAHFVILDNARAKSFDAKQFNWLKADLAANAQEHTFVFMHKPVFDPSEIYPDHIMSGRKVIEELMAIFRQHKVDYVFAGHIHGYARTVRDGTIYLVTAGAGANLYLPREFGGFYHCVRVDVKGNKIKDKVLMLYE